MGNRAARLVGDVQSCFAGGEDVPGPEEPPPEERYKSRVSETSVHITFRNETGVNVCMWWVNYSGEKVFYTVIPAGQTYRQQTFATHPWFFTSDRRNADLPSFEYFTVDKLYVFVAEEESREASIRRPDSIVWSKATHKLFPRAFRREVKAAMMAHRACERRGVCSACGASCDPDPDGDEGIGLGSIGISFVDDTDGAGCGGVAGRRHCPSKRHMTTRSMVKARKFVASTSPQNTARSAEPLPEDEEELYLLQVGAIKRVEGTPSSVGRVHPADSRQSMTEVKAVLEEGPSDVVPSPAFSDLSVASPEGGKCYCGIVCAQAVPTRTMSTRPLNLGDLPEDLVVKMAQLMSSEHKVPNVLNHPPAYLFAEAVAQRALPGRGIGAGVREP